jgi:hypothetical protein
VLARAPFQQSAELRVQLQGWLQQQLLLKMLLQLLQPAQPLLLLPWLLLLMRLLLQLARLPAAAAGLLPQQLLR